MKVSGCEINLVGPGISRLAFRMKLNSQLMPGSGRLPEMRWPQNEHVSSIDGFV